MGSMHLAPVTPRALPGYRRHVAVLTAALALLSLTWATTMPYFSGPDEIAHYNSTARLARGGGWPLPYEAPILGSSFNASDESGRVDSRTGHRQAPTTIGDRAFFIDPGDRVDARQDQMVQHPPGAYVVPAALVKLAGVARLRWDVAMVLMRLVSGIVFSSCLPFTIGSVTRLTGDQKIGILGGTAIVGIPFFTTMGGYVSNDPLLITATTAAAYGAVRLVTDPNHPGWMPIATGAALGIALLSKGYALLATPAIVALVLLAVRRRPPEDRGPLIRNSLIGATAAIALGGWWWIRNLVVLGRLQPSRLERFGRNDPTHDDYHLLEFLRGAANRLQATFWGRGARQGLAYPGILTWAATILLIAIVVIALVRGRHRLETLLLLAIPILLGTTITINAHRIYRVVHITSGGIRGVQGRYLFAGIVAFAVCSGWAMVVGRRVLGPERSRRLSPILVVLPWIISLAGLHRTVDLLADPQERASPDHDLHSALGAPVGWILATACLTLVVITAVTIHRNGPGAPAESPIAS